MVDFINEVEEELRKDEYNRLLRRYGPFLLGLIVAVIAVAGYLEWSEDRQDRAARATSAAYVSAAEQASEGEVDAAIRQFKAIADKAPAGYAGLSLMRAAVLSLDAGDVDQAIAYYDQAARRFTTERHIQLAQLKAAYILVGQGRYDDVMSRMGPLAQKDAPYEFLARELLALSALQSGDNEQARAQYGYLESIPGVPPSIQARAEQALSLMSVSKAAKSEASTTGQGDTDTPAADTPAADTPAADTLPAGTEEPDNNDADTANNGTANDE